MKAILKMGDWINDNAEVPNKGHLAVFRLGGRVAKKPSRPTAVLPPLPDNEARARIQQKLNVKKAAACQCHYIRKPRFDEVYLVGTEWLDSAAGKPVFQSAE